MDEQVRKMLAYGLSSLAAELVMQNFSMGQGLAPQDWEANSSGPSDELHKAFMQKLRRMLSGSGVPESEWPQLFREATLYERIVTDNYGIIKSYLCSATEPGVTSLAPPIPDAEWTDSMYDERDDESNFYAVQARSNYPGSFDMSYSKLSLAGFCQQYDIEFPNETPSCAPRM